MQWRKIAAGCCRSTVKKTLPEYLIPWPSQSRQQLCESRFLSNSLLDDEGNIEENLSKNDNDHCSTRRPESSEHQPKL